MTDIQIMGMLLSLLKGRMRDLELMELNFRILNTRVNNQGQLLGLLVELVRERFVGDEEDLTSILAVIKADEACSEQLKRQANRRQMRRDQAEAEIEALKATVDGPSEE